MSVNSDIIRDYHIQRLCQRIYYHLFLLRRLRRIFPRNLFTVYFYYMNCRGTDLVKSLNLYTILWYKRRVSRNTDVYRCSRDCTNLPSWSYCHEFWWLWHYYNDVIMGAIASQITSLTIVYPVVYSDADQRKHQSSASLAYVWIHRGPVNSPHK